MRKEVIIGICGLLFILMLVLALFRSRSVQDSAENALHEITTYDLWKQTAYTPAAYCPTYPGNMQQGATAGTAQIAPGAQQLVQPYQSWNMQQAAMANAPPIAPGANAPVLVKEIGAEVMPVGGGKVKITGVMGNSWADKAGLKQGDILLSFNTKRITGLKQFQGLLAQAAPEKNYKVTFLRGARTKKCVVTVGEGEMEGFTPIK